MNYVRKICVLADQCLDVNDVKRIEFWLTFRDLLSVKEVVTSEFIKFKKHKPEHLNDKINYDEKYAIFAELESTVNEYLRLNNYSEEELDNTIDEEY